MDKDPSKHMDTFCDNYTVKPWSIGEPELYLGADVRKLFYPDGFYTLSMGSTSYTKAAINNVKKCLADHNLRFNKKLSDPLYTPMNPLSTQYYRSELDVSNECDDFLTNYFQKLIGVLRQILELGHINISFKVSTLSKYLAFPRTGHIYQTLHIFQYLEVHINNELAFDPLFYELTDNQ